MYGVRACGGGVQSDLGGCVVTVRAVFEVQSDVLPCTNGEELCSVYGVEADVWHHSVSPALDARVSRVFAVL